MKTGHVPQLKAVVLNERVTVLVPWMGDSDPEDRWCCYFDNSCPLSQMSVLLVFELRKSFRRLSQSGRTKNLLPMSSTRLVRTTSVLLVPCPLLLFLNVVSGQKGLFLAPVVHRRLLSPVN